MNQYENRVMQLYIKRKKELDKINNERQKVVDQMNNDLKKFCSVFEKCKSPINISFIDCDGLKCVDLYSGVAGMVKKGNKFLVWYKKVFYIIKRKDAEHIMVSRIIGDTKSVITSIGKGNLVRCVVDNIKDYCIEKL